MSTPRTGTRAGASGTSSPAEPVQRATNWMRFLAWLVDLAIVAALFGGLWLFSLIRISGCEAFDSATNTFPAGCPFESTREVDGGIVYVLDSGRELPADHPTFEPPLLGIRVMDPPGASAYLITLVYVLGVFVIAQGVTGATPGKALVGVRLADEDGEPAGIPRAAVRWLVPDGGIGLLGVLIALAGGPWILRLLAADGVLRVVSWVTTALSPTDTSLGDRTAGTNVITAASFALAGYEDADDRDDADGHDDEGRIEAPSDRALSDRGWSSPQPEPNTAATSESAANATSPASAALGAPWATSARPPAPADEPSAGPTGDRPAPWAMPAPQATTGPVSVPPAGEPDTTDTTEGAAADEAPKQRFPWLPDRAEAAVEEEVLEEGWVAPTMEPPIVGELIDEPVPAADAIVGTPAPETTPPPEVVDAPGSAVPGSLGSAPPPEPADDWSSLPAVAPSAQPPADLATAPFTAAAPGAEAPAVAPSAEAPAVETPSEAPAATPEPTPTTVAAEAAAGPSSWPAGEPVWDPARNAYIFWDAAKAEWLQFNDQTGAWGPISRAD